MIRIRRVRRGEPVPEHVVRLRRTALLWAPLLLVLASATVLSAAFLAQVAGGPALSLDDGKEAMKDDAPAVPAIPGARPDGAARV
ncbi:hypothetical protein ACQP1W_45545 [Spirillospora sp. CA-255316]